MGYTTNFMGSFTLDHPLDPGHANYLHKFSKTRRMARNPEIAETLSDPERLAVGLPIGKDGEYFVGGTGFAGQGGDASIIDHNYPPPSQPGLWCQWVPTEDNAGIEWDHGEKFYDFVEWLKYLIEHFLKPWGYILNGEVEWRGEDIEDMGLIVVKDNIVTTKVGKIVYVDE